MADTETRTNRYFLSCRDKGCKGRRVVEHPALLSTTRMDALECPACTATYMTYRRLNGKVNADKGCDARCEMAKGPNCECECGGENHGVAHCG